MSKDKTPNKDYTTGTMASKLAKARRENVIRSCFKSAAAKLAGKPGTIFEGINSNDLSDEDEQ